MDYKRVDIGQDNTSDNEILYMKSQNLLLEVHLTHIKGTHRLTFVANYWKSENARAEGTIEFNENNGNNATARYRYTEGAGYIVQSGIYRIYRLEEDKTKLLVLYQHLFPRKQEYNPDDNRGWEIWQKQ